MADSTGVAVNSSAVSVTVDFVLVAPTVTSASGTVDLGQTSVLSLSALTTGTSPYNYQWFALAPSGSYAKVGTNSASYNFVTAGSSTTGSWSFMLQVADSTGVAVNSSAVSVTVDSVLVAPTVTAAPGTVDQGQTSLLSSSAVTTGSGGYTYQWFASAPNGSYAAVGTNSASYNFTTSVSNATGSWSFMLQVADSTGVAVNSSAVSVTVNFALVAPTVTAAPAKVNQGQTSVLSSSPVTSGTSPYTYQWFAKSPTGSYAKVGTNSESYNFITSASNATGSWSFMLQVADSMGVAVNSAAALVTVTARPLLPPWVIDLLIAIVVIAVVLIIILFAWRRRARKMGGEKNQPAVVAVEVNKVEIADNALKFFVAKGRRKKQWVIVKEIPVYEIEHIESFGNHLSVTWKGVTSSFFFKNKNESFGKLADDVNGILEEQRKALVNNEKVALRRNELLGVINASIGVVDLSFDVLLGLQEKRINWQLLEGYSNDFGERLSFTGQTLPPFNLEFSRINSAIKSQIAKDTSKEALNILEAMYRYFNSLSLDDDFKESRPNFQIAKDVVLAYFMLNDLLLGMVVGDKENKEENSQFEIVLQNLAAEANFKVDTDELKGLINKIGLDGDKGSVIKSSRGIFKEYLFFNAMRYLKDSVNY